MLVQNGNFLNKWFIFLFLINTLKFNVTFRSFRHTCIGCNIKYRDMETSLLQLSFIVFFLHQNSPCPKNFFIFKEQRENHSKFFVSVLVQTKNTIFNFFTRNMYCFRRELFMRYSDSMDNIKSEVCT